MFEQNEKDILDIKVLCLNGIRYEKVDRLAEEIDEVFSVLFFNLVKKKEGHIVDGKLRRVSSN